MIGFTGRPKNFACNDLVVDHRPKKPGARGIAGFAGFAIVAPFAIFATIRVAGFDHFWPLIPAMAFTPWVAAGAVVALLATLALRAWRAAAIAAVVVLAFATVLSGRALPDDQPSPRGPEITIVSQNMLAGGADPDELMAIIRTEDADVLALQEVTPDAVAALRERGLERVLPNFVDESRWAVAGAGLWSREPLVRVTFDHSPMQWPSPEAVVPKYGLQIRSLHPNPPMKPAMVDTWKSDLAGLPATPGPHDFLRILVGDYNATLDNRQLREVIGRGYVDAADALGAGLHFTWPAGRSTLTIDHLLVDKRARVLSYDTRRVSGTDHRAIVVRLRLPAG